MLTLLFYNMLNAQHSSENIKIDTLSIVFKAKLFTISQHEYESKEDIITQINNLPHELYGSNEFIFIKINAKKYCRDKNRYASFTWCDCDYYICYSIEKNVYYLLGGFEIDNINEFTKEYKFSSFSANWAYKVNDKPLSSFLEQMALGKIKKARNSFLKCTETWD